MGFIIVYLSRFMLVEDYCRENRNGKLGIS